MRPPNVERCIIADGLEATFHPAVSFKYGEPRSSPMRP
jgi:hypothetical protein